MLALGMLLIAILIVVAMVGVFITLFKGATKPGAPMDEAPRDESLSASPDAPPQRNLRGIDRG